MEKGLEGRKLTEVPPALAGPLASLWRQPSHANPKSSVIDHQASSVPLIRFAARLGSPEALKAAVARVNDANCPASDRMAVVELLGQIARPEDLPTLLALADDPRSRAILPETISALGGYQDPQVASRLLMLYPMLDASLRDRVLSLLCSRPSWSARLLDALAKGSLKAKELRPTHVLQIAAFHDADLTRRVESVWGRVPGPGSPEKIKRVAQVRGMLPEGDKGQAPLGQPVFKEHCAVCHKLFDEGENIGPELTGAERGNLDFLLTSLVDPSAMIRKEYQSQAVALRDGRILTGLVVEETDKAVTLIDSNRQKTVVPRADVEEMKTSPVSLMPEGLLDKLSEAQIRHLFKYLQSAGPARTK
jgi:putative heme-binding domain-containing protein